jgi:hypothetical protein
MQLERYQIEMLVGYHWLSVVVALMNHAFCFVRPRWYESFTLAGFKDLH